MSRRRHPTARAARTPPAPGRGAGGAGALATVNFALVGADVDGTMFERKPPIRSTQEDVPELAEQIDRFVIGLAERIDAIQDADLARDLVAADHLARQLGDEAERLGYPVMSRCARGVAIAARDAKLDALQEAVVELTDLAQRIRRGHRGAA